MGWGRQGKGKNGAGRNKRGQVVGVGKVNMQARKPGKAANLHGARACKAKSQAGGNLGEKGVGIKSCG